MTPRRRCPSLMPARVVAFWSLMPEIARAQQPGPPVQVGVATSDLAGSEEPSSTETGQSPLDESFAPRTHADWVRETRRKAWKDTRFDVQLRSHYLDRDRFDDSQAQAWALGGSIGLKTGYFRERFAVGATGYTSQRLHGPKDKDGTLLLKPGQHGYTVLARPPRNERGWMAPCQMDSVSAPSAVDVAGCTTGLVLPARQRPAALGGAS